MLSSFFFISSRFAGSMFFPSAPALPLAPPLASGPGARCGRAFGSVTSTLAPSRKRSMPSVTTRSPACNPDSMAATFASAGPSVTGRSVTVLSSFTT
jgi:hypothetical protein